MSALIKLLALSLLLRHSNSNTIDCANIAGTCKDTTQTCMSGQDCTILCKGSSLSTRICENAVFNCPESFTCTLICDNDGWAGGDGSNAGKICKNIEINGASNGDLFVTAIVERNFTHATNQIMGNGVIICGSSSICNVTCAGSDACKNVVINGTTDTQIDFQAITLPTITSGFRHVGAFSEGTINCGTKVNCNINCLGEESCPNTRFVGGNNGDLNVFVTGENALVQSFGDTEIIGPAFADFHIICECPDCVDGDEGSCEGARIDGTNSNSLTIDASDRHALFDAEVLCPIDSAPDDCIIVIVGDDNSNAITGAKIIANNGFLGFMLDCSQSLVCFESDGLILFPPTLICDVEQGLNCSIQAVNDEWNVFRCEEQGDDCDVSLSPSNNPSINPTTIPTESKDSDSDC